MSDATHALDIATRFADLVGRIAAEPSAVLAHREAATALGRALGAGGATLRVDVEGIVVEDVPADLPLLAARLQTYGVEELGLTPRAVVADLLDLARLVAAAPSGPDPVATFAARTAALDPRAIPRRFRPLNADFKPLAVEKARRGSGALLKVDVTLPETVVAVPKDPIVGAPGNPVARLSRQTGAMDLVPAAPPPPRPSRGLTVPAPGEGGRPTRRSRQSTGLGRPSRVKRASQAMPVVGAVRRTRAEPLRDLLPLTMPASARPGLATAIAAAEAAEDDAAFRIAVGLIGTEVELALRHGRTDDLLDGCVALLVLESRLLEGAAAAERLRELAQLIKRVAGPRLVREVARVRLDRAGDAEAAEVLQRLLLRVGVDGAEALIEECVSAPTPARRAAAEEALRAHRRAHDALEDLARDTRDLMVREAAALLAMLGDERAEAILASMLAHPDDRARAAAVTALGRIPTDSAAETATGGLADDSPLVRSRAIAVLAARRPTDIALRLAILIDAEPDRDVLFAAIDALGAAPTPEGVQALIRLANGEGQHPLGGSAALRVQACRALVIARAPTGMLAIQALRDDADKEVRAAAAHLVTSAQRRTTATGIPIVRD